ncbi:hypothetical protein FMM05_11100 [Flavobacterium zepuense]|uniref:Uncharacterized protein n=1 Tax=Flavobacterium zepuense TaxID=2593302 RepID=A0A552V1L4_9FLAO|nr:hypothetical protein [Flavobacterium zepuense]TRW24371.1 hypothetical protein FMM05_11100 [Flavobacterium zepuense]
MKFKILAFLLAPVLPATAQTYIVDDVEVIRVAVLRKNFYITKMVYETVNGSTTTGYSAVIYITDDIHKPYKRLFWEKVRPTREIAEKLLQFESNIFKDFYNTQIFKRWEWLNDSHWEDFSTENGKHPKFEMLLETGETVKDLWVGDMVKLK